MLSLSMASSSARNYATMELSALSDHSWRLVRSSPSRWVDSAAGPKRCVSLSRIRKIPANLHGGCFKVSAS